jgi:hypothetical protein
LNFTLRKLKFCLLLGRDLSDNRVDHTNGHCHLHVANSESSKRWVGLEGLANHGAHRAHDNIGSITGLDDLGVLLNDLVGTPVDLVLDCLELACNVACVAVENWGISVLDVLVVHHNHLGLECLGVCARVVLGIRRNVSAANILDRDVLHVESNVVTWASLWERLVVHLDGLDFSGDTSGSEGNHHTWLDDTSLDTANWHCADTANLVHVLEGKTEGKIVRALWLAHKVERLEQNGALVPRHLVRSVNHVIADPTGNGNEADRVLLVVDLVADLLKEASALLLDLLETSLVIENSVHLVDGNDHLLNSEGVGEQGVLAGLALLGDGGLELSGSGGDNKHGHVGLGGARDHVLDKVTVSWGVNNSVKVLGGLELPESNVNGDTAFSLGLKFVKHPRILERALSELSSLLLELLNRSLVDTSALVDQVSSCCGLARVYNYWKEKRSLES